MLIKSLHDGGKRLLGTGVLDHDRNVGVARTRAGAGRHGGGVPRESGRIALRHGGPLEVMCEPLMHLSGTFCLFLVLFCVVL